MMIRRRTKGGGVKCRILGDAEVEFLLKKAGRIPAGEELILEDPNAHPEEFFARKAGMSPEDLARFLGEAYDLPCIGSLDASKIDPKAVTMISRELASRHSLIPLFVINGRLIAAISSPKTLSVLNHLSREIKMPIDPVLTTPEQIEHAIAQFYRVLDEIGIEATDLSKNLHESKSFYYLERPDAEKDGGIIRLVDLIIRQAIDDRVSDIHVDPDDQTLVIRFRVAGVLEEVKRFPIQLAAGFISRIKILASMDIAERRLPQDGRIGILYRDREIDLRVSTLPTVVGEKVVMRILDKTRSLIGLDQLGLLPEIKEIFSQLIASPYGIFLISGPTGSGKTTTLYTTLNAINTREKNFITFEDPVEYRLPGINQVQVLPKAGLTFASGLRASLRQDPDVILVGEIRDLETAETAIHAALTGHLVLSTVHTNDAPSTVARLVDMGIEPFLIATSLVGVNAQRLVRQICKGCRAAYPADALIRGRLGLPDSAPQVKVYRGAGCRDCGGSGYRGQIGLFELMPVEDTLRALIAENAPTAALRDQARELGMLNLWEDGMIKVVQGITTLEEVLRVSTVE